jgi:hypothetical protein
MLILENANMLILGRYVFICKHKAKMCITAVVMTMPDHLGDYISNSIIQIFLELVKKFPAFMRSKV